MNATMTQTKVAATRTDAAVAATIHEQLGGCRFDIMTGAQHFIARRIGANGMNGGLFFALPTRGSFPNRVEIMLQPNDLYQVVFYRSRGMTLKIIKSVTDVSVEQLREVFRSTTQLEVSL